MELRRDRKDKAHVRERDKSKGVPKFLVEKPAYLLCLCQVAEHASLPPVWKALVDAPKRHQMTTLQSAFDNTARRMSIQAPIVMTPSLLNTTLSIGFHIYHRDNLGKGIHQFYLWHQTSTTRKVLKDRVDQHHVISGGGGAPTLADSAYLTAPDRVSLPEIVVLVQSSQNRLWVLLETLLGRDHPDAQGMDVVVLDLMNRETELWEYSPSDPSLKPNPPALLTQWTQIRLSDWIAWQWERGGREPFSDLEDI